NIGIKSGTNNFHGTGYYFHRNAALDARNYYNPTPQPTAALLLHQFGASIGGPILRDKRVFFSNYEGIPDQEGKPYDAFSPVTTSVAASGISHPERNSIVDALAFTVCDQTPLPPTCSQLSLTLIKFFPNNPGFTADPNDPTSINFNFNSQNRGDNLV